ncbi:hypothetical protein Tco_1157567, partial [Tanacetum coccineum]
FDLANLRKVRPDFKENGGSVNAFYCFSAHSSSLDGTMATFHFEVKEVSPRLSDVELEKLKKSCYSDIRG